MLGYADLEAELRDMENHVRLTEGLLLVLKEAIAEVCPPVQ